MLEDDNEKIICIEFVLKVFSFGGDLNKGSEEKDIYMSEKSKHHMNMIRKSLITSSRVFFAITISPQEYAALASW